MWFQRRRRTLVFNSICTIVKIDHGYVFDHIILEPTQTCADGLWIGTGYNVRLGYDELTILINFWFYSVN